MESGSAIPAALEGVQHNPNFEYRGFGVYTWDYWTDYTESEAAEYGADGYWDTDSESFEWWGDYPKYTTLFDKRIKTTAFQDVDKLKTNLRTWFDSKKCEELLNNLFAALGSTATYSSVAESILNGTNGYKLDQTTETIHFFQFQYKDRNGKNKNSYITPNAEADPKTNTVRFNNLPGKYEGNFFRNAVKTFIHEVLHLANPNGTRHKTIVDKIMTIEGYGEVWNAYKTSQSDKTDEELGGKTTELLNSWIEKTCDPESDGADWNRQMEEIKKP